MTIAVYPGSFDPITNGHVNIILRVSKFVDKLYIGVLDNPSKKPAFTSEDRVEFIKMVTQDHNNIEVVSFSGLLIDFVKKVNAGLIIRGLRAVTDFEYEFQMALTNKNLLPEAETFFVPTSIEFLFLSSSVVKEVAAYGGDISGMVPDQIKSIVINRFKE